MDSFSEASLILSNFWGSVQSEANSMHEHHKVSLLLVENQHRRQRMPQESMLYSLIVICLTILLFTWMVRDSLCELHIKQGNNELAASLACDMKQ